jgi:predicted Zn-dependent peptidase
MLDRVLARPATFTQHRQAGHYRLIATAEPARAAATVLDLRTRIAALGDGSDESRAAFVAARRAAVSSFVSGPRSSAQWNTVIENAIVNGVDLASLQALPERLSAVTYADTQAVIAAELAPEHEVLLLEGSKDAVNAAYAELGQGPTWIEVP